MKNIVKSSSKKSESLSQYLKGKRVQVGLTQMEVAEKLGYSSPQFVSNWERGLANPPVGVLRDLTKMYRVSPDEVFSILVSEVEADLRKEFYASKSRRKH